MKTLVALFMVSCSSLISGDVVFTDEHSHPQIARPFPGSPWPMPKLYNRHDATLTFDPTNLTISSDLENCDILQNAIDRLLHRLDIINEPIAPTRGTESRDNSSILVEDPNQEGILQENVLREIVLSVLSMSCPSYPTFGDIEDYNITITSRVLVQAETVWGSLHGLETLLQLMYTTGGHWRINQGRIEDSPRFQHRGLHLDTARHFFPVDVIKKNLVAMATNKLNVFHWALVGAQAFPYNSTTFPQLAEKGAFSSRHIYSQEDVHDVIEYARMHGIRVVPEFNTPGHAHSWGKAMPELLTPCWTGGQSDKANFSYYADRENFDPSKNSTYQFLSEFFQEVQSVFKDVSLHMGMDKADRMCWKSSPEIAAYMSSMGFREDYSLLEGYFNRRVLEIVRSLGRKAVVWADAVEHGSAIPTDTLVQVWKGHHRDSTLLPTWETYLRDALVKGYNVIFSSCWTLSDVSNEQDWRQLYTCDPNKVNGTDTQMAQIVGGEGCVWSQFLDSTNILQTLWPRASAVAERLWSPGGVTDLDEATFRLDQHRCRLVRMGIPAQPILPGFCREDYNTDNSIPQSSQHQQSTEMPSTVTDSVTTTNENDDISLNSTASPDKLSTTSTRESSVPKKPQDQSPNNLANVQFKISISAILVVILSTTLSVWFAA